MGAGLLTAAYGFVLEHNAGTPAPGVMLGPVELAVFGALALRADDATATVEAGRDDLCAASGIPATDAGRKRLQRAVRALAAAGGLSTAGRTARGAVTRYSLALNGGHHSPPIADRWTPQSTVPADATIPTPEDTPPAPPPPVDESSPYCAAHPTGTSTPCAACGAARRAARAASRPTSRRPRKRSHDCAVDGHRPLGDGTCMYCTELRPTASLSHL